ncbi:g1789 [Coccomyxa elongata]
MGMRVQSDGDLNGEDAVLKLKASVQDLLEADKALAEWCTDRTLRRYLAARNGNFANAKKMLQSTLEWRRSYKPHEITWETIADEATGKQIIAPCTDKEGRVVVIMRPREEKSRNTEKQIKFLVYTLELASKLADASGTNHKICWLVDFKGYSMRNAPSIRVSITTLSILQNHYPERLGMALCYLPPRLFSMSWKALLPFIDPVTAEKVVFVNSQNEAAVMAQNFHMDKMEACLGGKSSWTYNKESYSQFCRQLESKPSAGLLHPADTCTTQS